MQTHLRLAALTLLLLSTATAAQKLAVEFEEPFFQPTNLRLSIHDATGNGFQVLSPCADVAVFIGAQDGPQIPNVPSCGPGFTAVPAFGTLLWDWPAVDPGGSPWPESDYWFRVRAVDPTNGSPIEEWFCHRWKNSGTFLGLGAVNVGQSTSITLGAGPANGFYWIVLSRTQNNPFSLFGVDWCLSFDGTLASSITTPQGFFTNSFGVLDANGDVNATLDVPPTTALDYQGFALQALTIDIAGSGAYGSSNPVSRRILP